MDDPKEKEKKPGKTETDSEKHLKGEHLGSSNAFEKTENPFSKEAKDISDEKLDELMGD